jgi:hypothetical protein
MEAIDLFTEYGNTFTPLERVRKIGAGIRNWGFIHTVYTHAVANPQLNRPKGRGVKDHRHSRWLEEAPLKGAINSQLFLSTRII